jgi:hypothetical protein
LSRQGFGWQQIGVVGIAVSEMSKWREEVVRALTPDGADNISGFASDGVGAFHQHKIAVGGLGLPWSKQTEWRAVRNFAAAMGIGAENRRDQVAPAWRSVIRVNSEGRPSRSAKPGHSPVPLFTYSVIPSTS